MEFTKDEFKKLYNKLYEENFEELEHLKKEDEKSLKRVYKIIAFLIICILLYGTLLITGVSEMFKTDGELLAMIRIGATMFIGGPLIAVLVFVSILQIIKDVKNVSVAKRVGGSQEQNISKEKKYKDVFKEKIVKSIIKETFEDSEYYYDEGIEESEYRAGEWESYDIYNAEDKIETSIVLDNNEVINLIMSEVHTIDVRTDSDGDTDYVTMFNGLAGSVILPKDIDCYLKVKNNDIDAFRGSNEKIKMDMSEFERKFDVETNNKTKTMQLLTLDVMTEVVDIVEKNKFKFEFFIKGDVMHIRFHTGDLFEPIVFKSSMEYECLEKYYDTVITIKNIVRLLCNTIISTHL